MKTEHLTDSMIQEYALGLPPSIDVMQHLHTCPDCKTSVDVYHHMITGIKALPAAEFDFNVLELVNEKIEERSSAYSHAHLLWLFSLMGIGSIVVTAYLFAKYVTHLFSDAMNMSLYLTLTIVIALFLFSGIEIARKHKRQMDTITFS